MQLLSGSLRLVFFEVKLNPSQSRIADALRQLPQQGLALLQGSVGDPQSRQLDRGGLPIGPAAGSPYRLQQPLARLPPSVPRLRIRLGTQHAQPGVHSRGVELQRGAVGILPQQRLKLCFRRLDCALRCLLHDAVDRFYHLLLGQRVLELEQCIHIGLQRPGQRT